MEKRRTISHSAVRRARDRLHEIAARSKSVLAQPAPDTFAGRKTQDPFPAGDPQALISQFSELKDLRARVLHADQQLQRDIPSRKRVRSGTPNAQEIAALTIEQLGPQSAFAGESLMRIERTHPPRYWRMRAEEFRTKADSAKHSETRETLLKVAQQYDELARRAEIIRTVKDLEK